ncbi:SpaA isopeptide-forming pilin-related protein [Vagococcus carniphilus]|uniref:SpaA isopeptide-forming pilin-related protein n=1 Tax=Vagococcus carniphilus TaxID=218144 RepID=UPI003B5B956D
MIENIKADGKIFGVFTRNDIEVSSDVVVPKDSLLSVTTVADGVATFQLQLPQETYYLKELDAGESHTLISKEYEFTFTAENNHATFPIHLYDDVVATGNETLQRIAHTPILNKLHLNDFSIKKVNEQAIFDKETGMEFNFDKLGTGAIFTLEDEAGEIIQEVTIDEDGIGTFTSIPVGTFFMKEKTQSSE